MTSTILVLNVGSSTLKFALFDSAGLDLLCRGVIEDRGAGFQVRTSGPNAPAFAALPVAAGATLPAQIEWLLRTAATTFVNGPLVAVGHRVVHGGATFAEPAIVDAAMLDELAGFIPLAPAHQPHNIAAIAAVTAIAPKLPQIACFDTAFHRTQPRVAQLYPLPRALSDEGLLRFGFHGLSYEHVAQALVEVAPDHANSRVIAAHLGHGASLCAMRNRQSVATTMGFTSLEGLMMGTRSGSIDPGLILYLMRDRGMTVEAVGDLLNSRSGLLGVSGLSDDVRILAQSPDPSAAEALDLFAYRAAREIGSLMAAVGGLDLLVFTGGIGENSGALRAAICERLRWADVILDPARNEQGLPRISAETARVKVFVIPANEELVIATATRELTAGLAGGSGGKRRSPPSVR
ncbi:acetate/propionate family kinase [Sphingobium sp. CECT 9361]|uniref:acetate/propionate family kinase n=1 Tax=Sphingobium sp. CECT 9361 TaxID=2845384 RepID=UPI001E38B5AB|nr:acetate/propionate family kinase [Sphingobium sp. CECT 9361]CAH0350388.1 putative propionate kinase [Sphingobium sp. CECT 9361]